jgi:hypothetical protein
MKKKKKGHHFTTPSSSSATSPCSAAELISLLPRAGTVQFPLLVSQVSSVRSLERNKLVWSGSVSRVWQTKLAKLVLEVARDSSSRNCKGAEDPFSVSPGRLGHRIQHLHHITQLLQAKLARFSAPHASLVQCSVRSPMCYLPSTS